MDVRLLVVAYLMICVAATPYRSRKNSQPTYDQKQTGEYNIQLHLKDFEIVALVADSAFAEGDYDYQYDYSDITLKPSTGKPSTTSKPSTTTIPPKPSYTPSTTTITTSISDISTPIRTETTETRETPLLSSTSRKTTSLPVTPSTSTLPSVRLESELERNITKEEAKPQNTIKTELIVKPVESLTIVDKNESLEENLPLVVHRKCASGFTRDKNGRCRKVRRPPPQFSFGISRLANLASKLRGTNDSQTSSEPTLLEE